MFIPGLGKKTRDRQYGERAIANRDKIYEVCRTYERLLEAWAPAREQTKENFRFAEGNAWDETKEAQLKAAGLPALKINLIWPRLLRIHGQEIQIRKKIQAVPRKADVEDGAILANDVFDWVEWTSKMQDQFSFAFMHAIIGELGGWIEVRWNTDKDPLGVPEVRAWNPFFILDDPTVGIYDLRHKQVIIKSYMATFEEIVSMFPDKEEEMSKVMSWRKDFSFREQITTWWQRITGSQAMMHDDLINEREGTFRIIEMQKRVPKHKIIATNVMNGVQQEISKEAAAMLRDHPDIVVIERKYDEIRTLTTAADLVLLQDEPNEVQNGYFSIFPVAGFTVAEKSWGLVQQLKGPQEELNKARSAILHILSSVASSGWQVPEGSLDDAELAKLEQYGANPRYIQIYNRAAGKPEKILPNMPPSGEMLRADQARIDMEMISSIDKGELGLDAGQESGVLHRQKVQQAMLTLEPFFRNVDLTKEFVGEYILDLMRRKMHELKSGVRVIPVPRKDETRGLRFDNVQISAQDLEDEYAIVVKPGFDSDLQRFRILAMLTELERGMPPELVPWHLKIKYTDLPENDKTEYIEWVKGRLGPSPAEQQKIAQQLAALGEANPVEALQQQMPEAEQQL